MVLSMAGPLLSPGEHVVLQGGAEVGTWGRRRGYEVRDCVLVVEGGQVRPAWLFRAGLPGTVVEGVLSNGLGGLFVDGCRVTTSAMDAEAMERCNTPGSSSRNPRPDKSYNGHWKGSGLLDTTRGRWPSNTVLVHGAGCREAGVRRVRSTGIARSAPIVATRRTGVHADAGGHQAIGRQQPVTGYANDDGTEDVMAWSCGEGCLVPVLDEQSGNLHARGNVSLETAGRTKGQIAYGVYGRIRREPNPGDAGGASRFFPQLADVGGWFTTLLGGTR